MRNKIFSALFGGVFALIVAWSANPLAAAEPLDTVETNWEGITVHLMSLVRKGNVLTVKFTAINDGAERQDVAFGFAKDSDFLFLIQSSLPQSTTPKGQNPLI